MNFYDNSYNPIQANAPAFAAALRAAGMPAAAWCVEDVAAKLDELREQSAVLLDQDYELRKLDEENDGLRAERDQYKEFFDNVVMAFETEGRWPGAGPEDQNLLQAICDRLQGECE